MEGVTVSFAVSAGGGSLSDTSVDTDANGLAQTALTLGNDPGTNAVDGKCRRNHRNSNLQRRRLNCSNLTFPSHQVSALIHVPSEGED